ncbi:hypothetical protein ACSSNL_18120 [Thalassobius sp. S69A]|uniref:hypothetical protein n=1 Tax=unclassified Thalassovita TaxID=2619711 RepID=UPI003C7A3BD5
MALNPNIILAGNSPDLVNAMARGQQAGAQANQIQRQNALAQLYQQQGPQIMAGNQNALNALAQIDPGAAMSVQKDRQSMAATQQRMDALSAQERRAAEQYAASKSAAERQAEAQQIEDSVRMGLAAQSPQQWDQMMSQVAPDLVGRFAQKEMIAAKYMSMAEVLKSQQEPKPADEYQRYVQEEAAAGRKPLTRIEYAQAKKGEGFSVTTPDGVTITQGGARNIGPAPKMTVDAAKNSGFLIRTEAANEVLNSLENQGTRFWQQNAENIPMGLGNYLRDPDFQKFDQARRDFVNAILRRESGAVISDQEFDNADKQYFPMPGDSPEVIKQKRQNRENAIKGLRVGSGPGAEYVDQMAIAESVQDQLSDDDLIRKYGGE